MQVTELESTKLTKNFKIVVAAAMIEKEMEAELKVAGEQVKIPGFRPGFIPMKVLRQRYGKAVQADVIKNVINDSTTKLITERKLRPALMPKIDIESYNEGGDLTYKMSLEVFPEVPEITLDAITLERSVVDIGEKDVDEALARVAEYSPNFKRAETGTKAEKGQVVVIDFAGSIDGKLFDGGTAKDFRLELGSGQFIEGFEDQLIGAKEGDERNVKVIFPKEYHAKDLAGKPAEFAVTVKEIQRKEPAVVDDEFAKARGLADLRAFREAIRDRMIKEYDQLIRRHMKRDLFDVLEETYDFEVPKGMLEVEFNTIWERVKQAKAQGDESLKDKSEDALKSEYDAIAKRRVKLGILLAEIGSRNKIQVSREELNRAAMQQASQFPGQEKQVLEFYRKHPDRMEELRGPILEEKAVDFVLSKVKFNDKKVTIAELMAIEEGEGSGETTKKPAKSKSKSKTASKKKSEE